MMEWLKNFKPRISTKECQPHGSKFKATMYKNGPLIIDPTCRVTFISEDSDYQNGDILSDMFTEKQRLSAKLAYADKSPLEQWVAMTNRPTGTNEEIREKLYHLVKEASQFKPSLMIAVIRYVLPTEDLYILDISGGWGDRLNGAIALGAHLYWACDPNKELQPGYANIIECFGANPEKFHVEDGPFEKANLTDKFNVIFSSPPFFDFEKYSDSEGQSIKSYPTFNAWMEKFLFASLSKAWDALDDNGYCIIHMSDIYNIKICEPMCLYMLANLKNADFIGCYCSIGLAGKPRPMWVFKRGVGNPKLANKAREALYGIYKLQ
jgi:hypothetical protein